MRLRGFYTLGMIAGLLVGLAACRTIKVDEPIRVSASDWTTHGGAEDRANFAAVSDLIPPLRQAWRYGAVAGFGDGAPLVAGEYVFVGNLKGEVHVINRQTGRKEGVKRFGNAVEGAGAVTDRMLYVPNAWGRTVLYAFDFVQGRTMWTKRGAPIESGLLVTSDLVIAADVEANVRAYNRANGDSVWFHETDPTRAILASPALSEDRVIVVNDRGMVTALQLDTGTPVWTTELNRTVVQSPAVLGTRMFIPTVNGALHALDPRQGEALWTFALEDSLVKFSEPAVAPGQVIFGGSDGVLRALDPETGRLIWSFETDGNISAPPLIRGDLVFTGSHDKHLFALDLSTGMERWKTTLRGRMRSALAASDSTLIVLAEPRFVYAFTNEIPREDAAE